MQAYNIEMKKFVIAILIACVVIGSALVAPTNSLYSTKLEGIVSGNIIADYTPSDEEIANDAIAFLDGLLPYKNINKPTLLRDHFSSNQGGQLLDYNDDCHGEAHGLEITAELISALNLPSGYPFSWRIYKYRSGNSEPFYRIYWTNVDVASLTAGDTLEFVVVYDAARKTTTIGSATVGTNSFGANCIDHTTFASFSS